MEQRLGTNEEVREAYKGWDPRIDLMLSFVESVLEWRLYTHNPLPTWTHPSNKLTLIGDAAHAMTPYLAQGAAMGIEDAAILGGILSSPQYNTVETLPQALKLYEDIRIPRTTMVSERSVDSRWFTQMPDGPEQVERDEWLLAHPGIWPKHINIRSRKEFLDELFGYDSYKVLEAKLKETEKREQNGKDLEVGVAAVSLRA